MSTAPELILGYDSAIENGPKRCSQHHSALTNLITEGSRMADRQLPSAQDVRNLLSYDPRTGAFSWLERDLDSFASRRGGKVWNTKFAGKPAFAQTNEEGYCVGKLLGRFYRAHRLAWLLHTGQWPDGMIDHINGVRSDNRIANLRVVTAAENQQNRKGAVVNSRSGFVGVTFHKATNKWQANIGHGGRTIYLGIFEEPEAASAAYLAAKARFHTHGFKLEATDAKEQA